MNKIKVPFLKPVIVSLLLVGFAVCLGIFAGSCRNTTEQVSQPAGTSTNSVAVVPTPLLLWSQQKMFGR